MIDALARARDHRRVVRDPVDHEHAVAQVRSGLEARAARFLESLRVLVYEHDRSPYLRLLEAAGCEYGDVERSVRSEGLEPTLVALRDAGVFVDAAEWKGAAPIVRGRLELEVTPADFVNPHLTATIGRAGSSGSSGSAPRSTPFSKDGLSEAAGDCLLPLVPLGLAGAPVAVWIPAPPGSGAGAVLMWAKLGNPPRRWFSQTLPADGLRERALATAKSLLLLGTGVRLPRAEHTRLNEAVRVAEWLGGGPKPRLLMCFASSAVRVALAARERSIDISGTTCMLGGEPVSKDRHRVLREAGVRVLGNYGATEVGLAAMGCLDAAAEDDYHVYSHRIAVIHAREPASDGAAPLLFTSMSLAHGRVLLNVDIGDEGVLERRPCGCFLGGLGLDLHVSNVRSHAMKTSEGMTVPLQQLWEVLYEEVLERGGARDDCQIREHRDGDGLSRVIVAVSPHVDVGDGLAERVLARLATRNSGANLAADVWRQGETLRVVHELPAVSARGKVQPVLRQDGRLDERSPGA